MKGDYLSIEAFSKTKKGYLLNERPYNKILGHCQRNIGETFEVYAGSNLKIIGVFIKVEKTNKSTKPIFFLLLEGNPLYSMFRKNVYMRVDKIVEKQLKLLNHYSSGL